MFFTIAAALLGAAQPAPSDSDLACVIDRVPAATRSVILAEAGGGTPGPARAVVTEAASACASEHRWPDDHRRSVELAAGATILREESGIVLERVGIPVARVDAWFESQPQAVQTNVDMSDAKIMELVEHLVSGGVSFPTVAAQARPLGQYVGARIAIMRALTGAQR